MKHSFPWRTAAKIAWRESRASTTKFLFVVMAVAVGVGALSGVRGFSRAFRGMLLREARTLMAADLSLRVFALPDASQLALLDDLGSRGIRRTWITETVTMMSADTSVDPLLSSVKAVDPEVYPFYGRVTLDPPAPLAQALTAETIGVSEDVLVRLDARVGDEVRLGGATFRIAGIVTNEPDRMAGSLNVGPRVLMSRQAIERTELIRPGSRAAQRHLFRFPETPGSRTPPLDLVEKVRLELKEQFPGALIADFRETHPLITRGLNRATTFLSLVSLIALIVGALGVATAIHSHLQQKLDSIAVMKSVGGRSSQIIRIYTLQTLFLALAGSGLGLAAGLGVQAGFPLVLARYFAIAPGLALDWLSALEAVTIGVLSTLLFTVPPLLGIRRVRPGLILRRDMAESGAASESRWRRWREPVVAAAGLLAAIALVAAWLVGGSAQDAARLGGWFAGALAFSLVALSALSWFLLRVLRGVAASRLAHLPSAVRHGAANLYRPGNHAQAALVALSIGVMFTLTVYLVQHSMLRQMIASAPPGMPNVFLINVTDGERQGVEELLERAEGVVERPPLVASVAARLVAIDGAAVEPEDFDGPARRFLRERSVTWAGEQPDHTEVREGTWWTGRPSEPQISVAEEAATLLRVRPGAMLEWQISGRRVQARVAALHRTESIRPGANIEFIFSPGALDGLPVLYFGGVRMRPPDVARLQRDAFTRFPSVSVINVADVLDRVQQVVDEIALVVRFISAFTILAGVIILASSVAGTRFRRIREVVILKTLGATRRKVRAIFSMEFTLLGLAAGVMGALLASGFSALLLQRVMEVTPRFDLVPNLVAIGLTILLANAAGWLASARILDQKPLEALRGE
ncbi:MAG: FtsX-like permease family protein [Bryobacterales bacterium]|nr:FtsX-like permease family protein [Bryobacterales bacterium]